MKVCMNAGLKIGETAIYSHIIPSRFRGNLVSALENNQLVCTGDPFNLFLLWLCLCAVKSFNFIWFMCTPPIGLSQ